MKYILSPFIMVYHVVSGILGAPKKLFSKAEDKVIDSQEQKRIKKEQKEMEKLNANNTNTVETSAPLAQTPAQVQGTPVQTEQILTPEQQAELQQQQMLAAQQAAGGQPLAATNQPSATPDANSIDGQTSGVIATTAGAATQMGQEVKITDMVSETTNGEKAKRPMKSFRYTIINQLGKKETGTFDAEEEDDVRGFLLSQEYEILEVKERGKGDIDINLGNKLKADDLAFSLTQLSTYIKAGIPLVDGVRILAKQTQKPMLKKSFNQLVYELLRGESFSNAMLAQGEVYPKLLVNMVKTAEMTGDLPSILDDMSEYYTSMERTRKQMKSAMTYPVVVLVLAFGVLIFMLTYLVPQFTSMFESNDATLPALTLAIIGVSDFIKENYLILIIAVVAVIGTFIYLYAKVQSFRRTIQVIMMHLPVVKDIIIYNEIANFTKTFASLINHGVFITDSMEILSRITTNEIYKEIIDKTLVNLGKGDTISMAFKGEWAIPIVAYEMLVTGETTGQLGNMMEKVAAHFQDLHKSVIDQMKSLIEPIMILFLGVIVGIILLSIIQPMFSMYEQLQ